MKKLFLTTAIILALGMTSFAEGGGLFQRGADQNRATGVYNRELRPMLPDHGSDQNGDADTPLGTGIAVLAGLGAAYLIGKKRREE